MTITEDKTTFKQILSNLLSNAGKCTKFDKMGGILGSMTGESQL